MSELENILVLGPGSLDEIARIVGSVMSGSTVLMGEGLGFWEVGNRIGIFVSEYVNERGWDLERFDYVVDSEGDAQVEWAQRVFDLLTHRTDWDLLWLTDNGSRIAETRSTERAG